MQRSVSQWYHRPSEAPKASSVRSRDGRKSLATGPQAASWEHNVTGASSRTKSIGIYLVLLSLYQMGLYLLAGRNRYLFFDPRIALEYFLEEFFQLSETRVEFVQWMSAIWLLFLGLMLVVRGEFSKTYVISETLLGGLTFLFLVGMIMLQGGHAVPSLPELILPFLIFLAFTCFPLWLVIESRNKAD